VFSFTTGSFTAEETVSVAQIKRKSLFHIIGLNAVERRRRRRRACSSD